MQGDVKATWNLIQLEFSITKKQRILLLFEWFRHS